MAHPRFRGANAAHRTVHAAHRTVHAAFQAVEAPFRTSTAGFGSPGPCFRTSLARFRAVERRFRNREAVRKEVGRGAPRRRGVARGAEAGIVGRKRLQSPDGAEGSRKAMWFSEGIRPLPMRRNPKRRFRPTRAGSHRGGGNEEDGLDQGLAPSLALGSRRGPSSCQGELGGIAIARGFRPDPGIPGRLDHYSSARRGCLHAGVEGGHDGEDLHLALKVGERDVAEVAAGEAGVGNPGRPTLGSSPTM